MGEQIYSEEYGFGVLEATAVRFFKDGQPLPDIRWVSFKVRQESEFVDCHTSLKGVCMKINQGSTSFVLLASAKCFCTDRRTRQEVMRAQNGIEMDCMLSYYGRTPETFTVRSEEECKKLRFRLVGESLPSTCIQDICEGGRYFYNDTRPDGDVWLDARVTKVYDYPVTERICDVLAQDGQTIPITQSNFPQLTVPLPGQEGQREETRLEEMDREEEFLEKNDREEELLEKNVREEELLPYAEREGQTVNICWLEVKGAASYRVTLYRRVERLGYAPLYHLAEYETDRGTHFLSVTGLIGSGLLFRVSALDRAGEEIAHSRGISL